MAAKKKAAKKKATKKRSAGGAGSGLKKYNRFINSDRTVKSSLKKKKDLERKLKAENAKLAKAKKARAKKYKSSK